MQEPNQRFLHTKNTLAFHYLPTLALSKSGSGLKHPLTLSPPVRAPRFPDIILPAVSILTVV